MSRCSLFLRALVVAGVVGATFAAPAHAIEPGGKCVLKSALTVTLHTRAGIIESPLEPGATVELVSVGEGGVARVHSGDLSGLVSAADLESACAGSLRKCTLGAAVLMYEQPRSDSKSWRIKVGADVSVLKKGRTWAAVRVGDLQGFVKSDEITPACSIARAPASGDDATPVKGEAAPAESVDRGEGPGVLLVPFGLAGAAPAGIADALLDTLYERAAYYRPDAGRLGPDASRDQAWKDEVVAAAKRARGAEMAYVIVGQLSVEPPSKEAPLEDRYLLQLAVVEAKTGHVLRGVRVRPTTLAQDPWAEKVLAELLPALAAAPGSKLPTDTAGKVESPAESGPAPAANAAAGPAEVALTPWFANGWGYAALAGAAVLGAGSGVAGRFALDDNRRANEAVQTDPARASLRNTAFYEAVTADSLGVAAVGATIATVVVFATRAGLED